MKNNNKEKIFKLYLYHILSVYDEIAYFYHAILKIPILSIEFIDSMSCRIKTYKSNQDFETCLIRISGTFVACISVPENLNKLQNSRLNSELVAK